MATIDLKKLLGAAVKSERSALGISQEELAYRAGLHRTYVSDVERGARNPSIVSVEKLASALKTPVSALFEKAANMRETKQLVEILLVEDNARDVQITRRTFEKMRILNPLRVLRDGNEARDFLFAIGKYAHRAEIEPPQIILLNLSLPKKSGLEVLREIRTNDRTQNIAVIVLTVSNRDRDLDACRRLGLEGYIVKPLTFQNFSEATSELRFRWALVPPNQALSAAAF